MTMFAHIAAMAARASGALAIGAGLPEAASAIGVALPEAALAAVIVAGAVIDARSRRFPNALAAVAIVAGCLVAAWPALTAFVEAGSAPGLPSPGAVDLARAAAGRLASHAVPAVATAVALTALEARWRARRGSAGLGMGDVKLLLALMIADPMRGLSAFAAALVLLALACLALRKPSLPLIPFIAATWLPTLLI